MSRAIEPARSSRGLIGKHERRFTGFDDKVIVPFGC